MRTAASILWAFSLLVLCYQSGLSAADSVKLGGVESTDSSWVLVSDDGGKTYHRVTVPKTVRQATASGAPAKERPVRERTSTGVSAATMLPVGFQCSDAKALFDAIDSKLSSAQKKDEFETNEQYAGRVKGILGDVLVGPLTLNGERVFAFMCDMETFSDGSGKRFKYDASKQQFSVYASDDYDLFTKWEYGDTYIGENAYGAQTTVYRVKCYQLRLYCTNVGGYYFEEVAIPMNSSEARIASKHLRLVYIGTVSPPYARAERVDITPTRLIPKDGTKDLSTLYLALREIWIVRVDTGEVVKTVR